MGRTRGSAAYALLVLAGLALVAVGVVVAARGYAATGGPDGAVRGYFAALQAGDAPRALGYGAVPSGDRSLLTSTVLTEQQRIAPMDEFAITGLHRTGNRAVVDVRYMLGFPGAPQLVHAAVEVRQVAGDWRLAQVVVATTLNIEQAAQRASILGGEIPSGTVLLFPGAVPIRLDTPYLGLDAVHDHVELNADPTTDVFIDATSAGTQEATSVISADLLACLRGHGPITCPEPSERYVPGTLRGSLVTANPAYAVTVSADGIGEFEVTGTATVVGTWQVLHFDGSVHSGRGRVTMQVQAHGYAVPPLRLTWSLP